MINISHLTKRFGATLALDDVSFDVAPGTIVGFLEPNGAGKSTCLRVLTGLVRPDSGGATVGGVRYADLPNPAFAVGALLTVDCLHPGRTGRETLRLACLTMGLPFRRADEVLDEVGLTAAEGRRGVRGYSLGMRQRLGLAAALLGDPGALVLDEPANGLDPQGQRWLSELLRDRAARGCAVLLSSHQLHEVSRLADRVVMIGRGRVLADQPLTGTSDADLEERYFALTSGADRAA
jgi:ABC-2 type transport system ATP-binding protein